MTEKVVALKGGPVVQTGEPVPSVVKALEVFLDMARAGELVGVQLVGVSKDVNNTYSSFEGLMTMSIVGRMEAQKSCILNFLAEA